MNNSVRSPDPKRRGKERPVIYRQPKGSDDPIRKQNRFSTLDDMMEAEESPSVDEPVTRWKLNKVNWAHFQTLRAARLLEDTVRKTDDATESFASILINIAEETVPKTAMKSKKAKKPLGLQMTAKPLLNDVKEHYDNSIIAQHTII